MHKHTCVPFCHSYSFSLNAPCIHTPFCSNNVPLALFLSVKLQVSQDKRLLSQHFFLNYQLNAPENHFPDTHTHTDLTTDALLFSSTLTCNHIKSHSQTNELTHPLLKYHTTRHRHPAKYTYLDTPPKTHMQLQASAHWAHGCLLVVKACLVCR